MLILALLVQTAAPNNIVKITPAGDQSYTLELVTTESAEKAFYKMQAAAAEACKATSVASVGMPILGVTSRAPKRNQIVQRVRCKPAS